MHRSIARLMARIAGAALVPAGLILGLSGVHAADLPAPLQSLEAQGVEIGEPFEAPGGLTGYVISARGQTVTVYVTPDNEHAVIGTLLDADGNNLSQPVLDQASRAPLDPKIWDQLADSRWIADGAEDAGRVVYVFTDPNCPYCHRFWQMSRPWVEAGKVQLRHIMVGVIRPSSGPKAATLLASGNPSKALQAHERNYEQGGVTPRDDIPEAARKGVQANGALMQELGYRGTPTVVYRNEAGEVHHVQGLPRGDDLTQAMGGPRPE
ncbi:thiol:disulfide interchange protein DsbG [Arhodomonas aquaeolei]|uniref:thiol:disulfide interchange protein DsbG n=1 Tax=Arhodomonas aquaeolei TaxID=2369 RepID=UPI002169411D|nr:thiol:disulfide interchange protein DsbG [Arhodomonas aquaeolei]MCS4504330.1 thiol:disulfide interchange protein DsbG [Arhodomonas aquaeolei]